MRTRGSIPMEQKLPLRSNRVSLLTLAGIGLIAIISIMLINTSGFQSPYLSLPGEPNSQPTNPHEVDLLRQSGEEASRKSTGCVHCHQNTGDPHCKETLHIGCCDCHGGNPSSNNKQTAHVMPRFPDAWPGSANPVRSYTLLNHESAEFIQFVNPGDLRVAHISCGTTGCHGKEVLQNRKSMMAHGCMLWGAALYNNGAVPFKAARFGESYSLNGVPQRMQTVPPPSVEEQRRKGVLPFLDPLPRFEITQPGNVLRIFERGGRFRPEIGIPEVEEDPGRPINTRLSIRGLGTENRTDPTFLGLQKTRLFDPTTNFMGTNDHPGDYRSSGCSACHIVYANDRSGVHSGPYAKFGNRALSFSPDPMIPKNESGHPIAHQFAPGNSIPTSQCITCHIHPGTTVMNSYLGYMWWDEETDGRLMYPPKQKYPSAEEAAQVQIRNPNESAIRNNLADPEFVANLTDLNTQTRHTQFADFHGHGWAFRAVFKHDRKGHYLDHEGRVLTNVSNEQLRAAVALPNRIKEEYRRDNPVKPACNRDGLPVHMLDIHLEKGMHCIDCHFVQDMHGNTKLQGEVRAAIEITCVDCHGTVDNRATLRTTGPAAYTSGVDGSRNLEALRTPSGRPRFERRGEKIFQNSMVEKDMTWEVKQVADTINPAHPYYNKKAALAKTVRFGDDNKMVWGSLPPEGSGGCAHKNSQMNCIACHSSWNQSCYGCHLPQKANKKLPALHNEGDVSRNHISYNFQTLRDEVYMLARDGNVTGNHIGPARSSCAIHVGSYNGNRESIYVQQQTISGEGLSGIAFSTNVPHTVRGRGETKNCTDCHVSQQNDNNALMAQLLMHGTGYLNFMGRYCWVASGEHGLQAVEVTERDEPQAVFGSTLQELAFPDHFKKHLENDRQLQIAHEHPAKDIGQQFLHPFQKPEILALQYRGEYLTAACGTGGVRLFDVAFIDHKGFSERISTAPVSPLGQRFYVPTKYCTSVAAPTTLAPDPTRSHQPENCEQKVHPMYGNIYATDKYEGLIIIGVGTALNGNPLDNFLKREVTFNPDGVLNGARAISIIGTFAYICSDAGLVVISLDNPKEPKITCLLGKEWFSHATCVAAQFRYAYVCDKDGVKVLDITDPAKPKPVSKLKFKEAHSIYLARTYAYVAGGSEGLIILDIENPEHPRVEQIYNASGCINDLHDVKLGITYVSEFAYLADGKNGMRIVQLTNPDTPGNMGFSPKPEPVLIATYKLPEGGHALAISRALDRDRAVDEAGNQIAVFGRIGARPFNKEEQGKMYHRNGEVWRVSDDPDNPVYRQIRNPQQR